jgi:uncharacterized membrane protein
MASFEASSASGAPREGLVTLAHAIYALHAFSAVTGLVGTATIVGAFLTGWPSIIAVILNYAKRADVRGTYLESHFSWQIRTFWYSFFWVVIGIASPSRSSGCRSASRSSLRSASGSSTASSAAGWRCSKAGRCRFRSSPRARL